ncbi:MAG: helix-turn-helix transcriptional regulator [Chloroflexi bacterium]|nr:helix-turn-helix transcriptional regulator [Chloroflexota bacterium]
MRVDIDLRDISGADPSRFTTREIEVLALVARGKSNTTIASDLDIAKRTVQNHLNHILTKMAPPSWAEPRVYLSLWYFKESGRLQGN